MHHSLGQLRIRISTWGLRRNNRTTTSASSSTSPIPEVDADLSCGPLPPPSATTPSQLHGGLSDTDASQAGKCGLNQAQLEPLSLVQCSKSNMLHSQPTKSDRRGTQLTHK